MKAAWFETFGTAQDVLHIGEQAKPEAGPGEVLVKMKTSGVNPSDVKKRGGSIPTLLDAGLVIPHSDGAGVIEAVGEGVDATRVGQRVWVYQAQYARQLGNAADYVALDENRAVFLPDTCSFAEGACLGIPAMTAHRGVFADGPVKDKLILITGGAGRVGFYAIQWAKIGGATVVATASNEADQNLCKELGADFVINHREENWSEALLTATQGRKVDRVVDVEFGGNLPEVLKCINIGGYIATYASMSVPQPQLPFFQMMYLDLTIRMVIVYGMPEAAKEHAITDITAALTAEKLRHRIAHQLPFEDIKKSHELIESGGFGGCVVVDID
jgi:NADPH:quinone reductase-like Zn-dependent oxidoreductase